MFKRTLAVAAALHTLCAVSAFAADLPVKAKLAAPASVCVPGNCSGWYAGFGLTGTGTNADIIGNGINGSVFAAGGAIDLHGGYQLWNGSLYGAAEMAVGYAFSSPAGGNVPVANTFGNSFEGFELIKLGYNFFPSVQSAITTPSQSPVPLTVPANFMASTTPYLVFGGHQRHGKSEWTNGAGATTVITAGWSSFAEYLYSPAQQGQTPEQIVRLGLNRHF